MMNKIVILLVLLVGVCMAQECCRKWSPTIVQASDMSPNKLKELLNAHHPFIIKGGSFLGPDLRKKVFEIYSHGNIELWNQKNNYREIFKEEHDTRADNLCPCAEMSDTITNSSEDIATVQDKTGKDFQVVERAVFPYSETDEKILQPLLQSWAPWFGDIKKTNLFNTIFTSRGTTKGVLHFHNYDAFTNFATVGEGTKVILFPPQCSGALKTTLRKAKATVINGFGWKEQPLIEKGCGVTVKLENNDMCHFPMGWFHRVDHKGLYINIAFNMFFPEMLDERLKVILPQLEKEDADYLELWTRRHQHWIIIAPVTYFYGKLKRFVLERKMEVAAAIIALFFLYKVRSFGKK